MTANNKSDRAKVETMQAANWTPEAVYWKAKHDDAAARIAELEAELAKERELGDILREDLAQYVKLDESRGLYAYRKARGL